MINEMLSLPAEPATPGLRRSRPGATGHLVYGPYVPLTHGVYQVEFRVALAGPHPTADLPCAVLDVCSDSGTDVIVRQVLRTSDLGPELRVFTLLFVLRQVRRIEYRIAVMEGAELLVEAEPVITRVSAVLDEAPEPAIGIADADELARDTRRILRRLSPVALDGARKVRLGNPGDGGYVCIDDFDGIDTAFSFGINDDISWDRDAADRGLVIHQFDHTVADPAPDDPRMIFAPKRIDRHSGPDSQSLSDLVRACDKGRARPNIILKMDIECGEWPVFDATPEEDWARIAWVVCELHYFQGLAQAEHRAVVDRCLAKIDRVFAPVHVHANVWGGISSLANVIFPDVIEVTFANRACYGLRDGDELYPGPLDRTCDPLLPDLYIGGFRF